MRVLTAGTGFVHQSTLGVNENDHPLVVVGFGLHAGGRPDDGAACDAFGAAFDLIP